MTINLPLLFLVPAFLAVLSSWSTFFSRKSDFFINISSMSLSLWIASCGLGALSFLPPPNSLPSKLMMILLRYLRQNKWILREVYNGPTNVFFLMTKARVVRMTGQCEYSAVNENRIFSLVEKGLWPPIGRFTNYQTVSEEDCCEATPFIFWCIVFYI